MQRRVVLLMGLLLLLLPFTAQGATSIVAGDHLLPDVQNTYVIAIRAFGTDNLAGVNLNLRVGDGGATIGGTDVGPTITLIDAQTNGTSTDLDPVVAGNTIFALNANPSTFFAAGMVAGESFLTVSGFEQADANGNILAYVSIDTTGFTSASPGDLGPGKWSFNVSGVTAVGWPGSDWAGSATETLFDGSITIVPEPGSIVLCLFGLAGVAIVAIRRKRTRRAA